MVFKRSKPHIVLKSEQKTIPVRTEDGLITLRSESKNARKILDKMKIPYPGKILSSVPT